MKEDTTIRPNFNNHQLRERNHHKSNTNGSIAHEYATDLTYNSKGYGRVSKGLAILCIFIGCTSLFFLHTRSGGDLPCVEGDCTEQYTTHENAKSWFEKQADKSPFDTWAFKEFVSNINASNIEENLRYLTSVPHMGGTPVEWDQAEKLRLDWLKFGIDKAELTTYDVMLNYPDTSKYSGVQILNDKGQVKFTSSLMEDPVYVERMGKVQPPQEDDIVPAFMAFSASGVINAEEIVYVNYGRYEDFLYVTKTLGISLEGRIIMVRFGKIFRGNKMMWAERFGVIGAIIFSDPSDYHPDLGNEAGEAPYPHSWWLPGSGIQRGTIEWVDGDQSTPMYPAIEGAYRVDEKDADIPKIVVHPISINDARKILVLIGGQPAPKEWMGGLNVTYNMGPELMKPGWKIKLEVHNENKIVPGHNVMGYIYGNEEPDRYLVLGNHRDAWIYGSVDPNSATACMMEMVRVFGSMLKKGWRPRRTIVFASWGAGEHGYMGSLEWIEEFQTLLSDRTVAHVNVDLAVIHTFNMLGSATPLMHKVMTDASKRLPAPVPELGFKTLHDHWSQRGRYTGDKLISYDMGDTSDHVVFYQRLGIPCAYYLWMPNPGTWNDALYPIYHSAYENFDIMANILDPGFIYHKSVAQFWGSIALGVASPKFLTEAMNVEQVGKALREGLDIVHTKYGYILERENITTKYLSGFINKYASTAKKFNEMVKNLGAKKAQLDPISTRIINDQIMLIEKAFIDFAGVPRRPWQKNVVFGTNLESAYSGWIYPGVHEALFGFEDAEDKEKRLDEVRQQLAVISHVINSASTVLEDVRFPGTRKPIDKYMN